MDIRGMRLPLEQLKNGFKMPCTSSLRFSECVANLDSLNSIDHATLLFTPKTCVGSPSFSFFTAICRQRTDSKDGRCCTFPFTYKGITFNSCTTYKHNRLWCSFDRNYNGKWANCGKQLNEKVFD